MAHHQFLRPIKLVCGPHQPSYVGQPGLLPNGSGILGPAPALYPSQSSSLPSAFSTMTFQDPTWNMDTDATSHLISNASNLSTIFNKRLFPSIHVGDGNSIPVTNTRHSIIPSIHRLLGDAVIALVSGFFFVTCARHFTSMDYLLNEMLEEILVRVDVPELTLLRQVNRRIRDFISTPEFATSYNTRHQATSRLMVQLFTLDSPSIGFLLCNRQSVDGRMYFIDLRRFFFSFVEDGGSLLLVSVAGSLVRFIYESQDGNILLFVLNLFTAQLHSIELPEPVDIEHKFDEWQNLHFKIAPQFHVMGFNITNVVAVTNNNDGEILFIPPRHRHYRFPNHIWETSVSRQLRGLPILALDYTREPFVEQGETIVNITYTITTNGNPHSNANHAEWALDQTEWGLVVFSYDITNPAWNNEVFPLLQGLEYVDNLVFTPTLTIGRF
nr:ribonuclease H-like domain-containing protein [Tanacetum cinerariifolium]